MRFIDKTPSIGDERVIKVFLFIPRKIGRDIRWLETAKIRQRYVYRWKEPGTCWFDCDFVD